MITDCGSNISRIWSWIWHLACTIVALTSKSARSWFWHCSAFVGLQGSVCVNTPPWPTFLWNVAVDWHATWMKRNHWLACIFDETCPLVGLFLELGAAWCSYHGPHLELGATLMASIFSSAWCSHQGRSLQLGMTLRLSPASWRGRGPCPRHKSYVRHSLLAWACVLGWAHPLNLGLHL